MRDTGLATSMQASDGFADFEEFWPFYVSEHLDPRNRRLHFAGTTCALICLVLGVTRAARFLAAVPFAGYGFAWAGHFFFEKNRPATFIYPWWSLLGDFRMYGLMWRGRMGAEIERLRQAQEEQASSPQEVRAP